MSLNLARRPFANVRPLVRLVLLLWLLGAGLLAWNLWRTAELWRGFGERRAELARVTSESAAVRGEIESLGARLARVDFAELNQTSEFLNREIAARAFSWTRLFDRLVEVLPREVRLLRIAPSVERPSPNRRRNEPPPRSAVVLNFAGLAEHDEALLDLVDALFAHPAFADPDLHREASEPGRPISFDLTVRYFPDAGRERWTGAAESTEQQGAPVAERGAAPASERRAAAPASAGGAGLAAPGGRQAPAPRGAESLAEVAAAAASPASATAEAASPEVAGRERLPALSREERLTYFQELRRAQQAEPPVVPIDLGRPASATGALR